MTYWQRACLELGSRQVLVALQGVGDPVVISDFDEPEPELCVLLHPVQLCKILPVDVALLIEVSDSSYDHDHGTKLPRYVAAGISNVWPVNIHDHARPRLERYALGSGDRLEQSSGQVAAPSAALVLGLDALFAGLEALPSPQHRSYMIPRTPPPLNRLSRGVP